MTDQRDKAIDDGAGGVEIRSTSPHSAPLSRRALLRGVAIAAPTIVTMNSASAALAMTSVRTYTSTDAPDGGNYYCLADQGTLGPPPTPGGNPNALQVNSTSMPTVDYYGERDYLTALPESGSALNINEVDMCRNSHYAGTTYYYDASGVGSDWRPVTVKKGILTSAAVWGSLGVTPVQIDNL